MCTTELGRAANLKQEFAKRNVKMIAVSVDSVEDHKRWIGDIEQTQNATMNFPMLGDADRFLIGEDVTAFGTMPGVTSTTSPKSRGTTIVATC